MTSLRPSGRTADQMRSVSIEPHFSPYAEGSCLIRFGQTHVICTASVDERVPSFLRGTRQGWVTAEYGMLPRATHSRMEREAARGKQSGRTQEIQRLIGRSLRAVTDLNSLGERQIKIDCDVIQGTAEHTPFTPEQFSQMLGLAQNGCAALFSLQLNTSREMRPA